MVEIITGRINDFKTTTMKKRFEKDKKGDGFISLKHMKEKNVFSYEAMRLSTGEKKLLAKNKAFFHDDFIVRDQIGPYLFNGETMTWIEREIDRMIEARVNPIYFDEIGMLELSGKGFSSMLKRMVSSKLDLVLVVRRDLLEKVIAVFELDSDLRSDFMYDIRIKGTCLIEGIWSRTNIYIEGETIAKVSEDVFEAEHTIDAGKSLVIPGIIDPHVHFELDLGFIKSVDDFYSGSVAAVHGGVTSIVDFLAPVDNAEDLVKAYEERVSLAEKSVVDYAFHATIKDPKDDLESFIKTMKMLDMHTLKLFTTYSDSKRRTYDKDIIELLKLSDRYDIVLLAHIENDDMIKIDDDMTYRDLPRSRPSESETTEALKLAGFVERYGGTLYMVHLSSGKTLSALVEHYPKIINRNFLIESCPQYFTFTNDVLEKRDGELYTFAPPLRTKEERKHLFEFENYIDTFGTDHCAFMKADKRNRKLKDMPLGIGGIEHSFNVMYEHLGDSVIDRMTESVARIHRLKNKGKLKAGYDADLFFFKPEETILEGNHGTSDYSVYEGLKGKGRITHTMIRGMFVLDEKGFHKRKGRLIKGGKNDG